MHGLQALQSAFFRPNLLFLSLPHDSDRDPVVEKMIVEGREAGVGVLFLARHPSAGLGRKAAINLWIQRDISGWDVGRAFENNNLDLTLLMGFRLMRAWDAELNVVTAVTDADEREAADAFLAEVCDLARLPDGTGRTVLVGPFLEVLKKAPNADLQIQGLPTEPDLARLRDIVERARSSCLFVVDSGRESARA